MEALQLRLHKNPFSINFALAYAYDESDLSTVEGFEGTCWEGFLLRLLGRLSSEVGWNHYDTIRMRFCYSFMCGSILVKLFYFAELSVTNEELFGLCL